MLRSMTNQTPVGHVFYKSTFDTETGVLIRATRPVKIPYQYQKAWVERFRSRGYSKEPFSPVPESIDVKITDKCNFGGEDGPCGEYCSPPGTSIRLVNGLTKPIEAIKSGDTVLSIDPETKTKHLGRVTETYSRDFSGYLIELVLDNGATLHVTREHPILTARGWIKAGDLKEEDEVVYDTEGWQHP